MKKIFLLIAGFTLAVFLFFIFKVNNFYRQIYTPQKNQLNESKTSYNILLFGYSGGKHEGTYLTDTIMLLHLDLATKSATLISVPRDLWVKIPTTNNEELHTKINAIYQMELFPQSYPSVNKKHFGKLKDASFTKYILGKIFGLKIDNYVAVDFQGFKKAVDLLGGVEVEVEKSFTDHQYPIEGKENDLCDPSTEELFKKAEPFLKSEENLPEREKIFKEDPKLEEFVKNATESPELAFPCRYETVTFKKGKTLMNGEMALKYVRSRHSTEDGNDFSRAHRQQRFLLAAKNKVLSLGFLPKTFSFLDQLSDHIKTDLSPADIKKLTQEGINAKQYNFNTFVISSKNLLKEDFSADGQYILIPREGPDRWEGFQKEIANILKGKGLSSSPPPTAL